MNEPSNELAGRYRKLLDWYPRDHRERHGEEMLGVLLAGAGERTRPTRKETTDLLRGALRLHLRRMAGVDGAIDHRDVLAIVSLLGPIVMLAGAAPLLDTLAGRLQSGSPLTTLRGADIPDLPLWTTWFGVAVLSLLRLRRTAAVGAWLGTVAFVPAALLGWSYFWNALIVDTGWLLLGVVVAAALTWSPGPARGWELVGGKRVVLLAAAVVVSLMLVMKSLGTYSVLFFPMGQVTVAQGLSRLSLWFLALAMLVAGAVVACGARSREGRRAASVLCVPIVASVLMLVLPRESDLLLVAVLCLGTPAVVLLGMGSLPRRVRGTS